MALLTDRCDAGTQRHDDEPQETLPPLQRGRLVGETTTRPETSQGKPKDRHKLYDLHEPDVDCISKGKGRVRYEFGCKVSVATTLKEGFVVAMRSLPGNPYDGYTLHEALEQVEIVTDTRPRRAFVDRGFRGHAVVGTAVFISGQRRGMTPALKKGLRRRSAIDPTIGHMKTDGRLARCPLKGTIGDALVAVLCGCGHNIRLILAHLRALLVAILGTLLKLIASPTRASRPADTQVAPQA
jgi:IS5 family transposase